MAEKDSNKRKPRPFLRWAGGKTRLVKFFKAFLPSDFATLTYREPFLGAGSLFFALSPKRAVLSDKNVDLIACYTAVRDRPDLVSRYLRVLSKTASKDDYYLFRKKYNKSRNSIAKAALFLYLNKTCFNGIWRVNRKGEFNVPYGEKVTFAFPSRSDLLIVSKALKKVKLRDCDFREALKKAKRGDFIYLDPPYPALNETSYFNHYTQERFSEIDQINLAELVSELDRRGCRVLVSNADTKLIRSLYKGFTIIPHDVTRWISTDGNRFKVNEVAVLNYDLS